LVRQREAKVREMEALGESDLPNEVIRGRARKMQRELDAIDEEIRKAQPTGKFSHLYERMEDFDQRMWVETAIENAVLYPATEGNRWNPERLQITWRGEKPKRTRRKS
jgi:hypothetical protein